MAAYNFVNRNLVEQGQMAERLQAWRQQLISFRCLGLRLLEVAFSKQRIRTRGRQCYRDKRSVLDTALWRRPKHPGTHSAVRWKDRDDSRSNATRLRSSDPLGHS
jgi:hypothetical protein